METKRKSAKVVVSLLALAGLLVFSLFAVGGSLEPSAPPSSTMHSLDDIYSKVASTSSENRSSTGEPLTPAPQAYEMFLRIDGIPGESTHETHKDWIEVLSYSHSVYLPSSGSRSSGDTRTAERCDHQDFSVVKMLDKASPILALLCCNGQYIGEIRLELCQATGDKNRYMEYRFSDVIITAIRPGSSGLSGGARPLEEVSFNYSQIEWSYTAYDPDTGLPEGNVGAKWDLETNTGS